MSIEAMKWEIRNQTVGLPEYTSQLRNLRLPKTDSSDIVFTGSGDSYAAALFAHGLSGGTSLASNPYELSQSPSSSRGKQVVLVSVSGKTKASLTLAGRLRSIARKRIAVTANPDSQLAKLCDEAIVLQYRSAGKLTSGTAGFTASLLACAHILGKLPRRLDLEAKMERAIDWAASFKNSRSQSFLFVGSGISYALAVYGACKIQEVLGAKADAQYPEQLGHAQLFSLDPKRDTIVGISHGPMEKTTQVLKNLGGAGFRTHSTRSEGKELVSSSIEAAFCLQHLALALAKRRGLKECAFLSERRKLRLSNRLIY